jgi:hypothetical protein
MNVADFSSLITIIGCTAIAAGSAWHGKAGWFTIIFLKSNRRSPGFAGEAHGV